MTSPWSPNREKWDQFSLVFLKLGTWFNRMLSCLMAGGNLGVKLQLTGNFCFLNDRRAGIYCKIPGFFSVHPNPIQRMNWCRFFLLFSICSFCVIVNDLKPGEPANLSDKHTFESNIAPVFSSIYVWLTFWHFLFITLSWNIIYLKFH